MNRSHSARTPWRSSPNAAPVSPERVGELLQLVTAREYGTFSRFVLPIDYRLTPHTGQWKTVAYRETMVKSEVDGDTAFERKHYLTRETADVLFQRARWFELGRSRQTPNGAHDSFTIPADESARPLRVEMMAPKLVLFECTDALLHQRESPAGDADLLQSGFLIVELRFSESTVEHDTRPTLQDLMLLNELFRYWRIPFAGHEDEGYLRLLANVPAKYGSTETLATATTANGRYSQRWLSLLEQPLELADGSRWRLFPGDDSARYVTHADNRAYVWSCAVLEKGLSSLREAFPGNRQDRPDHLPAERFGHWIKLLNVDRPRSDDDVDHHKTTAFEQCWAAKRTYARWADDGTVYGFTQHSGVALMRPGYYVRNFADMYFDQTLLLLYLRVTTFRFSERLSRISAEARDSVRSSSTVWREEFDALRRDFALFTNLYQFPLVSNQQQGIELYSCARTSLDADELFDEIQSEIASTHEYFEIDDSRRHTQTATIFSLVGGAGLAIGLAMTFLSLNILQFNTVVWQEWRGGEWGVFAITLLLWGVIVSAIIWGMKFSLRRPSRRRQERRPQQVRRASMR